MRWRLPLGRRARRSSAHELVQSLPAGSTLRRATQPGMEGGSDDSTNDATSAVGAGSSPTEVKSNERKWSADNGRAPGAEGRCLVSSTCWMRQLSHKSEGGSNSKLCSWERGTVELLEVESPQGKCDDCNYSVHWEMALTLPSGVRKEHLITSNVTVQVFTVSGPDLSLPKDLAAESAATEDCSGLLYKLQLIGQACVSNWLLASEVELRNWMAHIRMALAKTSNPDSFSAIHPVNVVDGGGWTEQTGTMLLVFAYEKDGPETSAEAASPQGSKASACTPQKGSSDKAIISLMEPVDAKTVCRLNVSDSALSSFGHTVDSGDMWLEAKTKGRVEIVTEHKLPIFSFLSWNLKTSFVTKASGKEEIFTVLSSPSNIASGVDSMDLGYEVVQSSDTAYEVVKSSDSTISRPRVQSNVIKTLPAHSSSPAHVSLFAKAMSDSQIGRRPPEPLPRVPSEESLDGKLTSRQSPVYHYCERFGDCASPEKRRSNEVEGDYELTEFPQWPIRTGMHAEQRSGPRTSPSSPPPSSPATSPDRMLGASDKPAALAEGCSAQSSPRSPSPVVFGTSPRLRRKAPTPEQSPDDASEKSAGKPPQPSAGDEAQPVAILDTPCKSAKVLSETQCPPSTSALDPPPKSPLLSLRPPVLESRRELSPSPISTQHLHASSMTCLSLPDSVPPNTPRQSRASSLTGDARPLVPLPFSAASRLSDPDLASKDVQQRPTPRPRELRASTEALLQEDEERPPPVPQARQRLPCPMPLPPQSPQPAAPLAAERKASMERTPPASRADGESQGAPGAPPDRKASSTSAPELDDTENTSVTGKEAKSAQKAGLLDRLDSVGYLLVQGGTLSQDVQNRLAMPSPPNTSEGTAGTAVEVEEAGYIIVDSSSSRQTTSPCQVSPTPPPPQTPPQPPTTKPPVPTKPPPATLRRAGLGLPRYQSDQQLIEPVTNMEIAYSQVPVVPTRDARAFGMPLPTASKSGNEGDVAYYVLPNIPKPGTLPGRALCNIKPH